MVVAKRGKKDFMKGEKFKLVLEGCLEYEWEGKSWEGINGEGNLSTSEKDWVVYSLYSCNTKDYE